jgi:hypothetical protein
MSIEDQRAAAKRFYAERVDPIISWPAGSPRLAPMIAEMQRLNPGLDLRCALSTEPGDEEFVSFMARTARLRERLENAEPSESLLYAGTALDVVTIAMPEPPDDDMMSGLTEVNRESYHSDTDLGTFRFGPRRIERAANGSLLVRPRSQATESLFGYFGWAYQRQDAPIGERLRIQSRYGIYHDPYELWEVDFAYVPEWVFGRAPNGELLPPDPRTPETTTIFGGSSRSVPCPTLTDTTCRWKPILREREKSSRWVRSSQSSAT